MSGILDAPGVSRSSFKTGVFIPTDWGARWKAKLAAAGAGQAIISCNGDSIMRGYLSSAPHTKSVPGLLRTSLQATYGDGGSGWYGAVDTTVFATAAGVAAATQTAYTTNNTYWALTGTWTQPTQFGGPGSYYIASSTAGATITMTGLRGTTIRVFTISNGGGNAGWSYTIDSGGSTSVTDGAGFAVQTTTISLGSSGPHTLVITKDGTGATLNVLGADARNATGVIVDNWGRYGGTSINWASLDTMQSGTWSGGYRNPADLIIYGSLVNDCVSGISTLVTLSAQATSGAGTLSLGGYLPAGFYYLDFGNGAQETVEILNCTGSGTAFTANLRNSLKSTHTSGGAVTQTNISPEVWFRNARLFLDSVQGGGSAAGTTDILLLLPHLGKYDTGSVGHGHYHRAYSLARMYGAALIDLWAIGRNSWNYWNSLGYWGSSSTPGAAGADGVHPSDAALAVMANIVLPYLKA